jgi:hypothetical protein
VSFLLAVISERNFWIPAHKMLLKIMRCFVLARNGEILGLSISTSCPLQDAQLGGGGPSGTSSRHVRLHCGFSACS